MSARAPEVHDGVKHPLEHQWTLYFTLPYQSSRERTSEKRWDSVTKKVYSFAYIEDFWGVFNSFVDPTKMVKLSNLFMFKDPIKPKWEHPANDGGGKWFIELRGQQNAQNVARVKQLWELLCVMVISDNLPEIDLLVGTFFQAKKAFYRMGIWLKAADDADYRPLFQFLEEGLGQQGKFQRHQVSK